MPPPWYVKVGSCFLKPYESSLPAFFFLWFRSLILNLRSDFFRGPISGVLFFLWSGFLYLGSGFSRGWTSRIRFFLGLASRSRSNEERKPNFADLHELSKNGCNYLYEPFLISFVHYADVIKWNLFFGTPYSRRHLLSIVFWNWNGCFCFCFLLPCWCVT